jgi:hypothetical protein
MVAKHEVHAVSSLWLLMILRWWFLMQGISVINVVCVVTWPLLHFGFFSKNMAYFGRYLVQK